MKISFKQNVEIKNHNENGNILFTSLLIMLAMNFLGIALLQTAQKDYQTADFKTIDSSNFYLAESCINDAINWLKTNNRPPTNVPYAITKTSLSHLYSVNESSDNMAKLTGYSYNCTTTEVTIIATSGTTEGEGENISASSGYGANGNLSPDYYYEVSSNASGPRSSTKNITAIIAAQF